MFNRFAQAGCRFCAGRRKQSGSGPQIKVGVASVYRWVQSDGLSYKRPGPKGSHKLDREALRRHVEKHDDLTQAERAAHFDVSRHCIWHALRKLELTRKKNDGVQRA